MSSAAKSPVHHRILASGPSGKSILVISSRLELVIFDCDGVLVDGEPIINRAHAEVLTACGYPVTEEHLIERFCGMSDAEMLGIIASDRGRPLPPSSTERVAAIIEVGFCGSLTAIEGVAETLGSLTVPVCVASSSAPEQIRRKLELTGLLAHFGENLFSATMVARGKPAPDLFLYAAGRFSAAPGGCLVIEDSPAGIDAVMAAGMTAIGFCGGSHCGREHGAHLQARGAVLIIADIARPGAHNSEPRLSPCERVLLICWCVWNPSILADDETQIAERSGNRSPAK